MQTLELNQGEIPGSWEMVALTIRTKLGCRRSDGNASCTEPHAKEFPSGLTNKDQKLELTLYSLFNNIFY